MATDMSQYELDQYGVVRVDQRRYAPLDDVHITYTRHGAGDGPVTFDIRDGDGETYFRKTMRIADGTANFTATASGKPGLHIIRVYHAGENDDVESFWSTRQGSFLLDAETTASADGTDLDAFFEWQKFAIDASRDWAQYDGKWVAGHKAADNSTLNLAYPLFRLESGVYFEDTETLKGAIDLNFQHQQPDGSLFDHIYADKHPGWEGERAIRSMMADLEIGLIINAHQVWYATGDTQWIASLIEPMLRAWRYATSSPVLWSEAHQMIKRPHTPDYWDFQIGDESCFRNENSKYVVACCDAVRLPKAADRLAEMLEALGRDEAQTVRQFATDARKRGNDLLWDGTKYRHHVHIDEVDHSDFDEDDQLVMSNTWACTDGLADHDQAVSIIEEYERRLAETGDRYPWWSLQPGYPEGYFPERLPGVYANGGLFPLVGADLCRACFRFGFPDRGWTRFKEFWEQVKADDGACMTWYTLDGQAAANTHGTTLHDGWGIATWGRAAIEGVVGVEPLAPAMQRCQVRLNWHAGGMDRARVCIAAPSSRTYFAYDYHCDGEAVTLRFTGSGSEVTFILPDVELNEALLDGNVIEAHGNSLTVPITVAHTLELVFAAPLR